MQTTHDFKKTITKIPLNLDNILEGMRIDLPPYVIMEACDSWTEEKIASKRYNAEITLHNYLEGIKLNVNISGVSIGKLVTKEFTITPKSNKILPGWDFAENEEIELTVDLELLNGQIIKLLEKHKVPVQTKFKQLIFYS